MFFTWRRQPGKKKIALFFDSENVPSRYFPLVINHLEKFGKPTIVKIYVNENFSREWLYMKKKFPIIQLVLIDKLEKKHQNAADIQMSLDILEHIHNDNIDTVSIISSDADFYHIVKKANEKGVESIIFAKEGSFSTYKEICTQFVDISSIDREITLSSHKSHKEEWVDLAIQVVKNHGRKSGFVNIKKLTNIMAHNFNMDPKDFGYKSWNNAIKSHQSIFQYKKQSKLVFVGLAEAA